MEPVGAHLISERVHDIERDVALENQARFDDAGAPSTPTWRRQGGAAARRLSIALADLAAELDPAVCRPSYGRE